MNGEKKLVAYLIFVNVVGLLISLAVALIAGLFEALIIFPFALMLSASTVYLKHKDQDAGDSDNSEVDSLIVPEN